MFSIAVKRHERIWEDRGKRRAGECRPAPALERYAAQDERHGNHRQQRRPQRDLQRDQQDLDVDRRDEKLAVVRQRPARVVLPAQQQQLPLRQL